MPIPSRRKLHELAEAGLLTCFDLDVIMVALGSLTYEAVDVYLDPARRSEPGAHGRRLDVPDAAAEVVDRICGCQFQDGGATDLVSADERSVHLRVTGACVHCPQIHYTMRLLKGALRFLAPQVEEIHIDGTRFGERREVPANSQVTLAMMLKDTGLTLHDLDDALERKGRLTDDDIVRLGRLKKRGFLSIVHSKNHHQSSIHGTKEP